VLCLDPSTTITHSHILCDLPFHSVPPEFLLQILIHLLTSRVYRVSCLMSFLEDQFPNRLDIGNTQAVLEPYHTFCIFLKIFAFQYQLSDLTDLLIILLCFFDFPLQGGFQLNCYSSHIVQKSEAQPVKLFGQFIRHRMSDHQIDLTLPAQSVCHYVRFAWMVMNL
jgi:hypothetical protein